MIDDFARRLKRLRKEKRITQEELGYRMEVGRSTVANWENGIRCPSPVTMRKLAVFFNVSSDYLYGRTMERRNVVASPTSEMDFTKLNADGMRMIAEIYRLLVKDDRYRAEEN